MGRWVSLLFESKCRLEWKKVKLEPRRHDILKK